jgi:hypothetical protein
MCGKGMRGFSAGLGTGGRVLVKGLRTGEKIQGFFLALLVRMTAVGETGCRCVGRECGIPRVRSWQVWRACSRGALGKEIQGFFLALLVRMTAVVETGCRGGGMRMRDSLTTGFLDVVLAGSGVARQNNGG